MSKKAFLLTSKDVPEYVKVIVHRLHPVLMEYRDDEGDWWGYTFRLDAKWKCGYESQLQKDCEKLLNWCKTWYAHASLIQYRFWYTETKPSHKLDRGTKWHYRKALRENWHNHAFLVISDPVARRFENDGFYR